MIFHTEYLWFNTQNRREIVPITRDVEQVLRESGISEGFALVSAMHITSGVIVNDDELGLHQDIWEWLEDLAPAKPGYRHHRTGEDNADAHLKRILVPHQAMIPVTKGKLDLGPWERIFYLEADGQRRKRGVVKVMGE